MAFFGRKTLDGSLNGDEAAAFGATLYAAKLSTSFRLREFNIADLYPHAASIKISGFDDAADEGAEATRKPKLLFKVTRPSLPCYLPLEGP